jgi:hypothetical protein
VHTNWLSESSGVPPRHLTKIRKKDLALITGYDKDLALKVRKREVLHHPYSEQSLKVLVDAMLMTDPSAWPDSPLMTEKVVELKEIPRLVIHQIKKKVEPVKILPKGESPAFKKWRDIQ